MIDNSKEYILCAAIRRKHTRNCTQVMYKKDIYNVELGLRHCEILHRFIGELKNDEDSDQGFMTSHGRYVDRVEAAKIAYECGQINKPSNYLFSEDIY